MVRARDDRDVIPKVDASHAVSPRRALARRRHRCGHPSSERCARLGRVVVDRGCTPNPSSTFSGTRLRPASTRRSSPYAAVDTRGALFGLHDRRISGGAEHRPRRAAVEQHDAFVIETFADREARDGPELLSVDVQVAMAGVLYVAVHERVRQHSATIENRRRLCSSRSHVSDSSGGDAPFVSGAARLPANSPAGHPFAPIGEASAGPSARPP